MFLAGCNIFGHNGMRAKKHGNGQNNSSMFAEHSWKLRQHSPHQHWSGAYHLLQKKHPEREREIVLESDVSVQIMNKTELTPEELQTIKKSRRPTAVLTTNGSIDTTKEATVFVKMCICSYQCHSSNSTGSAQGIGLQDLPEWL